jgi:hypothetical protein
MRVVDNFAVCLTLRIDPAADPLTGTVGEPSGPERTFTGWTELGHAIDTAIQAARQHVGSARLDGSGRTGAQRATKEGEAADEH